LDVGLGGDEVDFEAGRKLEGFLLVSRGEPGGGADAGCEGVVLGRCGARGSGLGGRGAETRHKERGDGTEGAGYAYAFLYFCAEVVFI